MPQYRNLPYLCRLRCLAWATAERRARIYGIGERDRSA